MFPTLIVLVSTDLWLRYFLTGSGFSVFNNFSGFFLPGIPNPPPPPPASTCVNFQLWQWVLEFKYVLYEEVPLNWFPSPCPPRSATRWSSLVCLLETFYLFHIAFLIASYPSKYLSFCLKNLFSWFSHRAVSMSLFILVALLCIL